MLQLRLLAGPYLTRAVANEAMQANRHKRGSNKERVEEVPPSFCFGLGCVSEKGHLIFPMLIKKDSPPCIYCCDENRF